MSRYQTKANDLIQAWRARYPNADLPSLSTVLNIMSVAEHETGAGDSWDHSGSWGALQRRVGGSPVPRDDFEQLHKDSSPINGSYKAWYWTFPTGIVYPPSGVDGDIAGAWMLLKVLLDNRPYIKLHIDEMSSYDLARAMYLSHYFEGVHDPRLQPGETVDATGMTPGQLANVQDYSNAITKTKAAYANGLGSWSPSDAPPYVFTPAPSKYNWGWGLFAALLAAGGATVWYRHEKGLPIIPTKWQHALTTKNSQLRYSNPRFPKYCAACFSETHHMVRIRGTVYTAAYLSRDGKSYSHVLCLPHARHAAQYGITVYPEPPSQSLVENPVRTYAAAKNEVFNALAAHGWTVKRDLKVPWAESPDGIMRLWFRSQAVWYSGGAGYSLADARSTWIDVRTMSGEEFVAKIEKEYKTEF